MDAEEVYTAVFGSALEEAYDSGWISTDEFLERLRAVLHVRAAGEDIARAWSDIYTPNAPVAEVIRALKARGTRLVLGSNTNALHHAWFGRQFADTLAHFDAHVVSYRVGCRKPDRRFFDACIAATGYPADACLYIDDRPDLVEAGRASGLHAIVYTPELDLASALLADTL